MFQASAAFFYMSHSDRDTRLVSLGYIFFVAGSELSRYYLHITFIPAPISSCPCISQVHLLSMDRMASTTDSDVKKPASTHSKEAWCKCPRPVGRNLVVCIDGTSNQFGPKVRSPAIFREKVWSSRCADGANCRTPTLSLSIVLLKRMTGNSRSTTAVLGRMQEKGGGITGRCWIIR